MSENDGAMRAAQELSVSPCATVFDLDAAAAIIRRETNQWIPCDKRMPTEGDGDENGQVTFTKNGRRYSTRWNTSEPNFTHWVCNPTLPPEKS